MVFISETDEIIEEINEVDSSPSLFGGDYSDVDPNYSTESSSDSEDNIDESKNDVAIRNKVVNRKKISYSETSTTVVTLIMESILDRVMRKVTKPKRWRKSNPSEWKLNIAKRRRAEGSTYITKNKIRAAKVPQHINCSICKYKYTEKFTENYRNKLCRNYWTLDFKSKKKNYFT